MRSFEQAANLNSLSTFEALTMKETDPAIIAQQTRIGYELAGESYARLFNNFHASLPGGYYRTLAIETNMLNEPFVTTDNEEALAAHSERAQKATFGEFLSDMDLAVQETGIAGRLRFLRAAQQASTDPKTSEKFVERICYAGKPVYVLMREWGWSHYDLWR